MKSLYDSVQYAKGVGPQRLKLLDRLGIRTVNDLLYFLPRDYEDRSVITPIAKLRVGERATICARVLSAEKFRSGRGRGMAQAEVGDGSGVLTCKWFDARYFKEADFSAGRELLISGKVDFYNGPQIVSPQHESTDEGESVFGARILPIYPLTERLPQRLLRRVTQQAVAEYADMVPDIFDQRYCRQRNLMPIAEAVRTIHFPDSMDKVPLARKRLAYDELFLLELGMAIRRRDIRADDMGFSFDVSAKVDKRIRQRFPFALTKAQEKAIAEIREDMQSSRAMNRMLQGDVGSGKTVVALYAMLAAVANKYQAALMAPTEILATQHYETIGRYLSESRVRTALLVGGLTGRERAKEIRRVEDGEADIVVGTHALIEGVVKFKKLGMAVVDEQHKFGVLQRSSLRQKGHHPDVLVMTATPIPRTLALTVFGDLDISVLDEMPPGRKRIESRWFTKKEYGQAYGFIKEHVKNGEQAFFVYPLVEESEALDLKSAVTSADHLQRKVFPEFRVALLHGRMKPDEKDSIMREFRAGRYHILVSTIVIEVGIDIPNATIMVVEHAERFGMAQLHQLRGRIGRGDKPSHFFMFGEPKSPEARTRLSVICSTSDGFRIAEEDLKMRGPGEFFGTRQHGLPELKIADIVSDYSLLRLARRDAFQFLARAPALSLPEHRLVRERLEETFKGRLDLIRVG